MEYIIERPILEFLWTALNNPARAGSSLLARATFEKIVKLGWATVFEFEELFRWLEPKLNLTEFDVWKVSTALGIRWESFTYLSWPSQKDFHWELGMRANDVAVFLIRLEQIGFACDAAYLVNLLRPALTSRSKKTFSESELAIKRFEKERHRYGELFLLADRRKNLPLYAKVEKRITTHSGYRLAMKQDTGGQIVSIQISSPKQPREQVETKPVVCIECGTSWEKGNPDSAYAHKLTHRKLMKYLDPQPHNQFLKAMQAGQEPGIVTWNSPLWMRREMYERALAFKREMHYEFCQWEEPGHATDKGAVGYLMANEQGAILGAYCFRKRANRDTTEIWRLDWVWIAPKYRRMGYFARQWKALRETYGDFAIESPVSDEMKLFIKSQDDGRLLSI